MALLAIAARKLIKDLGYGMRVPSILSSVSFAVCLFFYLYIVGSFFNIIIYPLIDRVTVYLFFQENIVNEYVDNIIAIVAASMWLLFSLNNRVIRYSFSITYGGIGVVLAAISPDNIIFAIITLLSLPLIIIIVSLYYSYYYKRHENFLNFNAKLTLRYISLAVIAISVTWIVVSILAFFIAPDFESIARDSYANQLFLLLSSFAPFYIFLLVFCLPVKVLFREALRIVKLNIKEDVSQTFSNDYEQNRLRTQTKVGFLLVAMLLSVIWVLIPQHPTINIDNQDIGVDTRYYVPWIEELAKSNSAFDFAYRAFVVQGQDGDRPLSLIFLFLLYQITGGALSEALEYSPIVLGPGIVLAVYFLTLELARNGKIALIAAFLGSVSFHTLAGIYAGFYANWLALIVGYISIVFLFRYLRSGRPSDIVVFSALLISVSFFHVYTWTVLAVVTGIFLIVILLMRNKNDNNNHFSKRRIIWLLLFGVGLSIAVDLVRASLTGSSTGLEQDIEIAQRALGPEHFGARWQVLNATMHDSLGAVFSNFIILVLGLIWVLKSNLREPGTVFLMIFLSVGVVPLFFGNWALQARTFYDIPFEIPAAISLYYLKNRSGSIFVVLATCTWLAAVSMFTVMNYYFIPTPGTR